MVMVGVPLSITDEQLKKGVIEGLRPEVAQEAHARLEKIECKRLQRRWGVPKPPSEIGTDAVAPTQVPSHAI